MAKKIDLPKIGLGTMMGGSKSAQKAFAEAIQMGFRFLDTAQIYFNEKTVGEAVKDSKVPRDEITIATKIWISNFKPNRLIRSAKRSLKRLQLDYVDILYLHSSPILAQYKIDGPFLKEFGCD